jgi:hypothetical protein
LHLKGVDNDKALKLKGLEQVSQGSSDLRLKLGGHDSPQPYGIPGLPGTYTGGARDGDATSSVIRLNSRWPLRNYQDPTGKLPRKPPWTLPHGIPP